MDPTINQIEQKATELREKLQRGEIAHGNVEIAAVLGSKVAQRALGRPASAGMAFQEFIRFLLEDPNLHIKVDIK